MDETARILVVDDDENIRKVLTTILEDEGYIIESVDTAKKAIEKTKRKFYHLALIDIRLPDMEGIELLTKMKPTIPRMRKKNNHYRLPNASKRNRGSEQRRRRLHSKAL